MSSFDAETLARQLAQLGRDLQDEVAALADFEEQAVNAEGKYRTYDALYEDALASCLLRSGQGNSEARKAEARLQCIDPRLVMQQAYTEWGHAKAAVRSQQANLTALHKRIEIGRSLLSREKALIGLGGIGET
jgi:hypothetical protein